MPSQNRPYQPTTRDSNKDKWGRVLKLAGKDPAVWVEKGCRWIAARCEVSEKFVRKVRDEMKAPRLRPGDGKPVEEKPTKKGRGVRGK